MYIPMTTVMSMALLELCKVEFAQVSRLPLDKNTEWEAVSGKYELDKASGMLEPTCTGSPEWTVHIFSQLCTF